MPNAAFSNKLFQILNAAEGARSKVLRTFSLILRFARASRSSQDLVRRFQPTRLLDWRGSWVDQTLS